MSIDKCPNCGSLDLGPGFCRKCFESFGDSPVADANGHEQIPPPSPEPPAGDASTLPRLEDAEHAITTAATPEARGKAWDVWEDALFEYYSCGYRLVTLIGLSGAGKTFFANRLRYEFRLRKGWTVDPYEQDAITQTEAKVECTQLVRQGGRRRVLADCDGEAYRRAIEQLLKSEAIPEFLRRYVLITSLASAYILMVKAPEEVRKDKDLIERFGLIVSAILALQRRLREMGDPRAVVRRGLVADDVRAAKEFEFTTDRPVQVLFSQADRYPSLAPHVADPLGYAIERAPELVRTIDNHFTNYRFDFVSAFYGHANGAGPMAQVNYAQPHSGVVDAFDWVDTMLERPRLWQHSTRAAMFARRLVDGRFRKTGRSLGVW